MNTTMIFIGVYYVLCIKLGLWIGVAFTDRTREREVNRDIKAREALARVHRRVVR